MSTPRVQIRFTSEGLTERDFAPLELPGRFDVNLDQVDPDLLTHLAAHYTVALTEGSHTIPLSRSLDIPVEIAAGTTVQGRLVAEATAEGTTISQLSLDISPGLDLRNIVPVLTRLNTLFQDRSISRFITEQRLLTGPVRRPRTGLRRRIERRVRPRLDRWLPPGSAERQALHDLRVALEGGGEQLADVVLTRVEARPVRRGDVTALSLHFWGTFNVLGRAPVPFRSVQLPALLLPLPHATLKGLLSGDPLATAVLHRDRVPVVDLAMALSRAIGGLEATVELETRVPEVEAHLDLPGRDQLLVSASTADTARAELQVVGEVTEHDLVLRAERVHADLAGGQIDLDAELHIELTGDHDPDDTVAGAITVAAIDGAWPRDALSVDLDARLHEGSRLEALSGRVRYRHDVLYGEADIGLDLTEIAGHGSVRLEGLDPASGTGRATATSFDTSMSFQGRTGSWLDGPNARFEISSLAGTAGGHIDVDAEQLHIRLTGLTSAAVDVASTLGPLPELELESGALVGQTEARVQVDLRLHEHTRDDGLAVLDLDGSRAEVVLDRFELALDDRTLTLPTDSRFHLSVEHGLLDSSAWGEAELGIQWDLQGQSPVLTRGEARAELFVDALRKGELQARITPVGGLVIHGEDTGSLWDARYWNALLNPDQELDRWLAILDDDLALQHVIDTATVFSEEAGTWVSAARDLARRIQTAVEAEGIATPGDFIPARTITRVLSRVLVESTELEERLFPIVEQTTSGRGLDVRAAKILLEETLPLHDWGFELDRGLRWLAQVLSPTRPIPPRPVRELLPVARVPVHAQRLRALPDASCLYATIGSEEPLPAEFSAAVGRLSSYLSLEQIEWILAAERTDWRPVDHTRLKHTQALKRRVRALSEDYGGPGYLFQALAIAMWVGPTVEWVPSEATLPIPGEPAELLGHPDCPLGPEDAAVLLQAGLAAPLNDRVVQHNQRLLLELVFAQPPEFTRSVLVHMSGANAEALVGVLMALLDLPQGIVREPLDMVEELSSRLSLRLPLLTDYLAGGRYARRSYYQALGVAAERILAEAEPWLALRSHLQVVHHEVHPGPVDTPENTALLRAARRAVAEAEALSDTCTFRGRELARQNRARAAWHEAFAACRALTEADPVAFRRPWVKALMAREYEALMVRSVVRNVQHDVDDTRPWLRRRLGRAIPRSLQGMIDAVIKVLYWDPADRERLRTDPLVRLLVDPPEGRYDMTIVAAMGVVTDGAEGVELARAFARLADTYGIEAIRADTANVRSLHYNALRIEEAVRQVDGPWGYIGYSQGCANGLVAETRLRGGTPEQQAHAERLVGRHLLFSAVNGSGHGTSGEWKMRQAMIDGDHLVAHYQAVLSRQAVGIGLQLFRMALDSRLLVHTMGGMDSVSQEGADRVGRELQAVGTAPTTTLRGIVTDDLRPEGLDLLSQALTAQIESELHDTQIHIDDSHGYPVRIRSPHADQLREVEIGSRPQLTHHWSPLHATVDFLTTDRDRERRIYDFPEDRHVFPWVELLATFGLIAVR